jgi:phosphoglycolate phosphatase
MSALLWDLDGTLVDSAGDICAAVNATLAVFGLPPLDEGVIRRFIGNGARSLVSRCVEAAGARYEADHLRVFLATYGDHVADRTVVHPPELRPFLDGCERPMAIVTNKPEGLTLRLLEVLDLRRYFPVVLGGDSLPTRKPDPAMLHEAMRRLGVADAVVIGDGEPDVVAGHAAGLWVVGVGWGIARPTGADVLVETVAELAAVLAIRPPTRYR